jgi:hypothetical protein
MRDKCRCGAPLTVLPESPLAEGPVYHCSNGHFLTNPGDDFAHQLPGDPVSFWMPRADWEKLPVYTGHPPTDDHTLFRDADRLGVVYRWMGAHWWQATLSFERTGTAKLPD